MHQYSSQVLPHLSELDKTSLSQKKKPPLMRNPSLLHILKKDLADVSKLLIVQPTSGSNEPSPFSPPPTPIVEEADSNTNPIASY